LSEPAPPTSGGAPCPIVRDTDENKNQLSPTNRATRWFTANVLQTNEVDAQCDKLATELSWQHFASKVAHFGYTAPAFNLLRLRLAPLLGVTPSEFADIFGIRKL